MKLLFVLNNESARGVELMYVGLIVTPPQKRAVEIELTPEQIAKIGVRTLGENCGKPVLETIESITEVLEIKL